MVETRRDFVESIPRRLGAVATGAVLLKEGIAQAANQVVEAVGVCLDRKEVGRDSLLKKACAHKIDDPEKRLQMMESLRSFTAFEEFGEIAQRQLDLAGRTWSGLYPGAGSHIAPIAIALRLIEDDAIDNATCTFTEVDECKAQELEENLRLFASIMPDVIFRNEVALQSCGREGIETTYTLLYRGKPITIRFVFNCSTTPLWFQDDDYKNTRLFIQHDSAGQDVQYIAFMALQSMTAAEQNGVEPRPLIMEDTTRINNKKSHRTGRYGRLFDLELLGTFTRGTEPYGHRKKEKTKLLRFSDTQACRVQGAVKAWNPIDGYTADDITLWQEEQVAPERYMDVWTETSDHADCQNAVFMTPHKALQNISSDERALLAEISIVAKNGEYANDDGEFNVLSYRRRIIEMFKEKERDDTLFGMELLEDVMTKRAKIFDTINSINPKLAEALALRIFQVIIKLREKLPEWIEKNHPTDYPAGYQRVHNILNHAQQYLGQRVQREVTPDLKILIDDLESMRRYQHLYGEKERSAQAWYKGPTRDENETLAEQLYQAYDVKCELWEKHVVERNARKREKAAENLNELADRLFEAISKTA